MKKTGFSFEMGDLNDYLTEKLNFKQKKEKGEKKEKDVKKSDTDKDNLENLTSLNTQSKMIEKNLIRKVTLIVVVIPIVIFFIAVFYNTYKILQKQGERKVAKVVKNDENLSLKLHETYQWRIIKDQQINSLSNQLSTLKTSLKKDMNKTIQTVSTKLKENSSFIINKMKEIQDDIKKSQDDLSKNLNKVIDRQNELDAKVAKQIAIVNSKIENVKKGVNNGSFNSIKLPKLPPLKFARSSKKNENNNNKTKVTATQNKSNIKTKGKQGKRIEYKIETAVVTQTQINYSSIETNSNKNQNKTSLPSFTLMPGFAKGILINGGEVPAMLNGATAPTPIYIRLNGDELIPNDDSVNVDGCLVLATAKGDLSKKAVDIRLSHITCNLTDLDGNKYKIDQAIEGWVFGENGNYGVSGRLVTREGEIIKAGLPLTLVESMINGLNAAISNSTNNGTALLGTTNSGTNIKNGTLQGLNTGTNAVLKKFSDYYLKMLEVLNPSISIRAGRKVVIAFKGGEVMKLTKYKPINTAYFSDSSVEEGVLNVE